MKRQFIKVQAGMVKYPGIIYKGESLIKISSICYPVSTMIVSTKRLYFSNCHIYLYKLETEIPLCSTIKEGVHSARQQKERKIESSCELFFMECSQKFPCDTFYHFTFARTQSQTRSHKDRLNTIHFFNLQWL